MVQCIIQTFYTVHRIMFSKYVFLIQSSVPEANMVEMELEVADNNQDQVQVHTILITIAWLDSQT